MNYRVSDVEYLRNYLKYATEFERNVYIWQGAMDKTNEKMRRIHNQRAVLERECASTEKQLVYINNPHQLLNFQGESEKYEKRYKLSVKVFIVLEVVALLLAALVMFLPKVGFAVKLICSVSIILVLSILNLIITIPFYIFNKSRYKECYNKKNSTYDLDSKRRKRIIVESQMSNLKTELEDNKIAERTLSVRQEEIFGAYRQARSNLERLYSENVLPVKYRSFNAVATMYEYLSTGRCNTIQGHGGIYDTYENDLRMGLIIQNLENINATLSRVEENQQLLYNELRQANSTLQQINSSLDNIKQTNAEIAYNTAISAEANRQTASAAQWFTWRAWANGF